MTFRGKKTPPSSSSIINS